MIAGPQEYQFHDMMGVLLSSNGTIVVGDMGSSQIRFFDSRGQHLRTAGRNGSGPGEIGQLLRILDFRGDTGLMVDGRGPVHFFAGDGDYASLGLHAGNRPGATILPDRPLLRISGVRRTTWR